MAWVVENLYTTLPESGHEIYYLPASHLMIIIDPAVNLLFFSCSGF